MIEDNKSGVEYAAIITPETRKKSTLNGPRSISGSEYAEIPTREMRKERIKAEIAHTKIERARHRRKADDLERMLVKVTSTIETPEGGRY